MTRNDERDEEYSSKTPAGQEDRDNDKDLFHRAGETTDPRHSSDIIPSDGHEEISD